ncbi:MAG: sugar phosphate isomerase/epimerase [Verrucomicrobia bacterium]|nr:sugar phosphate isomerase/epimerase [Verrucomicrobiota bacterium]
MKKILFLSLISFLFVACSSEKTDNAQVELGLQSWTCRNMSFEETVLFAAKSGIKYVEFFRGHIDPAAPEEENLRKKAFLEQNGVVAYSIGVSRTSMDKEENRKLFEVAKLFGMEVVVVEPKNMAEWDNLEELVKEYDIKLAIHNHGTGTVYGNPATVKEVLAARDPRIGVCMDIGWVVAAGHDPLETYKGYNGRVSDMHFKDKKVEQKDGKPVPVDTLIGEGDAGFIALFDEMKRTAWKGVIAIETDSKAFQEDPTELVEGAKAFFKTHMESDSRPPATPRAMSY